MSAYLIVRRWVDGLWASPGNQIKVTLLPAFAGALLIGLSGVRSEIVWAAYFFSAAAWVGFVWWRGWRAAKAAAVRGDRHYDRIGKFELASEYHGTESSTSARRRRRHG